MRFSSSALAAVGFLLVLVLGGEAIAQTSTVPLLAGVNLRLGMGKEAVLAKLAVAPDTRLLEIGTDWYEVLTKKPEAWVGAGDVVFRDDKLTRVGLYMVGQSASSVATALYDAVGQGNANNTATAWARINSDPDPPVREVHFMFADREVVVSSSSPARVEVVSVQVYFPRVLAKDTRP
jgi:hypothetical protein